MFHNFFFTFPEVAGIFSPDMIVEEQLVLTLSIFPGVFIIIIRKAAAIKYFQVSTDFSWTSLAIICFRDKCETPRL